MNALRTGAVRLPYGPRTTLPRPARGEGKEIKENIKGIMQRRQGLVRTLFATRVDSLVETMRGALSSPYARSSALRITPVRPT